MFSVKNLYHCKLDQNYTKQLLNYLNIPIYGTAYHQDPIDFQLWRRDATHDSAAPRLSVFQLFILASNIR